MADLRPADDNTIPDDELLYIRVYPSPDVLVPVGDGQFRLASGAVRRAANKDEPKSVDLGSHCSPEETRDRGTNGNFHVAEITAGSARALGLRVVRDPIPEGQEGGPNPAHALVIGSRKNANGDLTGGLTTTECEKFARVARARLFAPENPAIG